MTWIFGFSSPRNMIIDQGPYSTFRIEKDGGKNQHGTHPRRYRSLMETTHTALRCGLFRPSFPAFRNPSFGCYVLTIPQNAVLPGGADERRSLYWPGAALPNDSEDRKTEQLGAVLCKWVLSG